MSTCFLTHLGAVLFLKSSFIATCFHNTMPYLLITEFTWYLKHPIRSKPSFAIL